jgi:hypothetical protein
VPVAVHHHVEHHRVAHASYSHPSGQRCGHGWIAPSRVCYH